jgi:hypothetical protein
MEQFKRESMRRVLSYFNHLDFLLQRVPINMEVPRPYFDADDGLRYWYDPYQDVVYADKWRGFIEPTPRVRKWETLYEFIGCMRDEMPEWSWDKILTQVTNQLNAHIVSIMSNVQQWLVGESIPILQIGWKFSDPLGPEKKKLTRSIKEERIVKFANRYILANRHIGNTSVIVDDIKYKYHPNLNRDSAWDIHDMSFSDEVSQGVGMALIPDNVIDAMYELLLEKFIKEGIE